jgi:hypothetical protein
MSVSTVPVPPISIKREKMLHDTVIFWSLCQNTLPDCVFARYHYNFVTHLPEHTALPKTESLTLLFKMTVLEENMPNFLFLAMRCVLAKTQSGSVFWQTTKNNGVL